MESRHTRRGSRDSNESSRERGSWERHSTACAGRRDRSGRRSGRAPSGEGREGRSSGEQNGERGRWRRRRGEHDRRADLRADAEMDYRQGSRGEALEAEEGHLAHSKRAKFHGDYGDEGDRLHRAERCGRMERGRGAAAAGSPSAASRDRAAGCEAGGSESSRRATLDRRSRSRERRPPPPHKEENKQTVGIEEYIHASGLDSRATEAIHILEKEMLDIILSEGVLSGRNPSSLLMHRIRQLTGNQDSSILEAKAKAKTQGCRHFQRGFCRLGDTCNFAHEHTDGEAAHPSAKPAVVVPPRITSPAPTAEPLVVVPRWPQATPPKGVLVAPPQAAAAVREPASLVRPKGCLVPPRPIREPLTLPKLAAARPLAGPCSLDKDAASRACALALSPAARGGYLFPRGLRAATPPPPPGRAAAGGREALASREARPRAELDGSLGDDLASLADARQKLLDGLRTFEEVAASSLWAAAGQAPLAACEPEASERRQRKGWTADEIFPPPVPDSSAVPEWLEDLDLARFKTDPERPRNYKTVLCRHFQFNSCKAGDKCSFIHEKGTGPFGKGPVMTSPLEGRDPPNAKTQMCKHFEAGTCMRAARCSFAHGAHELRTAVTQAGTIRLRLPSAHGGPSLASLPPPAIEAAANAAAMKLEAMSQLALENAIPMELQAELELRAQLQLQSGYDPGLPWPELQDGGMQGNNTGLLALGR